MANYRSVKYDQTLAKGLATARTIAGQSFDGTANITISLENLSNVDTTGLANNKIIKYNSTSSNWEIADDAGGGSGIALTDLSVGSEPSASGDGALAYNNSSGVFTYTPPLNISGTAAIATTVTITDNESTNENNAIVFTAGGDVDGGNLGLESDGTLTYNPSTGKITATGFVGALTGDVTGNADTATALATARTIHGVSFDGTGNIDLTEVIEDTVGAMFSSNTETNITATYQDADGTIDLVIGTLNQDTTGNAATATALATARTIHGVSFDGTGNIDLSEVIQDTVGAMFSSNTETGIAVSYEDGDGTIDLVVGTLNQDTTGNAATATALETARTIGGTSFDGSANIAVALSATATALATARTIHGVSFDGTANIDLTEVVQDTVGAMFSSNTETGITVTYQDADGTIDLVVGTLNQDTTGNAATATALETARTIGGVSFDGTGNINLPGVNTSGNQDTSGTAAKVTVTDSNANTNFPVVFHDESNALLDDTGALRYNPSTGELLVPNLTVAGTTTQVNTVTMNAQNAVVFEGATANDFETTLTITDPTADRTITMPDATGTMALTSSDISGNAATATALETARTIGGVSFDGTGNINLPGVNTSGNQDTSGTAATATALATARNIAGNSFDGTGNITIASTDLSDTSNLVRNNQNNTITSTTAGSSAAPEFELFRDITGADANYIGQIKFSADNDANQKTVFAKISGKIGDASDGTEDGIIEIAHKKAGSNNIGVRITSTEFKILNGTDFDVETHDGSSNGLRLANTLVTATAAEINRLDGIGSAAVGLTDTQTLTNKTLTTPIANAGIQLKNGATSAGFLEFFEDSDNGTNKVTFIGPASTADVTITLPATAGTVVTTGDSNTVTGTMIDDDTVAEANMADDAIGSAQLKSLSTLLIKNSSGSTLKTVHGAGA